MTPHALLRPHLGYPPQASLGFVPLPAAVMGSLALVTVAYLVLVYVVNRWFFKRHQLD